MEVIIVQDGAVEQRALLGWHDDDRGGLDQRPRSDRPAREDATALCGVAADFQTVSRIWPQIVERAPEAPLKRPLKSCGSGVVPLAIASANRSRRRGGAGGWRHLSGRGGRGGFVLFLHSGLEGFDAFGEIAHHPGQLAGAEQDQDNGQDDQPMH